MTEGAGAEAAAAITSLKKGEVAQRAEELLAGKGRKQHEMPCHHNLESYLHAYLDGTGLGADPKGPLFPTISRKTNQLTSTPLPQANAHAMDPPARRGRRRQDSHRQSELSREGITAFLKNGGAIEKCRRDGQSRLDQNDPALRSPARRCEP